MKVCPKCYTQTEAEEGSCVCPEYHGRVGSGFCPLFVDGMTAAETTKFYHDLFVKEADDSDKLRKEVHRLCTRNLLARMFSCR